MKLGNAAITQTATDRSLEVDVDAAPAVSALAAQQDRLAPLVRAKHRVDGDDLAGDRIDPPSRHDIGGESFDALRTLDPLGLRATDVLTHGMGDNAARGP